MEKISAEFHKVVTEILRNILECASKDSKITKDEKALIENYTKLSESYHGILKKVIQDTGSKSLVQKTLSKAYSEIVESIKKQALEDGRITLDEAAILGILMNDLFRGISGIMYNLD